RVRVPNSLWRKGFLHPHPRVTPLAKKIASVAPLDLSRKGAGEGKKERPVPKFGKALLTRGR
ncbi:MAG: hypothetical protein WA005_00790, partial [Candidatus Binataceae bacterium]